MMENKKTFDEFYESELVPEIQKQEEDRKRFKKKFLIYLFTTIALLLLIIILVGNTLLADLEGFYFLSIFSIVPLFIFFGKYFESYKKKFTAVYKDNVIKKLINYVDESLEYSPLGGFPKSQYIKSGIFKSKFNRYSADDFIKGKIGETSIYFSEVHTSYKTSGENSSNRPIFDGIFYQADFNKEFNGKTYVIPDFGSFGNKITMSKSGRPPLVKLEDPEFERYFEVYSEDQVEARYILSTALMKRLTEFRKKSQMLIAVSFINNNIFIAIRKSQTFFEPNIFSTNLNKEDILEYYNMLELVVGIVDDLNLNNRIWAGSQMSNN